MLAFNEIRIFQMKSSLYSGSFVTVKAKRVFHISTRGDINSKSQPTTLRLVKRTFPISGDILVLPCYVNSPSTSVILYFNIKCHGKINSNFEARQYKIVN